MEKNGAEVKEIGRKEVAECFLLELEAASNGMDTIAGYFERMRGHVENDDSPENYWMMGFSAGFKLAREISSEYNGIAIINSSRKLHGES